MDIQNQQQYKFFYGTKSQFDRLKGLGIVNPNHLYYITDKQQIYVGEDCYSSEFLIVDEFPIEPKINTIYIHKDTKEVRVFDGTEFNTVCLPVLDNLNVDYSIATSKAIKEYIKNISDTNITNIKYNKTSQSFDVYYGDGETETILLKDIITGVEYDATNGNFKFSQANGEDILINTPKENFLADVTYDPYKNTIKFVMVNGSTFEVDLTDLIEIYTTENTSTINMNISNNKIFANVKLSENEGNRATVDNSGLYIPDTDLSNYYTSTETNDLITNITDPIQREVDRLEIDKQNNLTAGVGIRINNNVISSVLQSVEWGNIQGDILEQEDLQKQFTELQTNIETNISNTASELQENINKLEQQTNENANELNTNLTKDIQQVQTNLNNTKTDLSKDIQQVQTNLNTVEDNLSGDITDLSNELSATEQEIQTELDTKVNLDDMVEIEMVEVDIDGIKSDIKNLENTKQNNLTSANAGDGISIVDGIISNTRVSAEWGKITGVLSNQTDLQNTLNTKANTSDIKNGKLTIQANGTTIATFNANQSTDTTANIQIPDSATWGKITGTLSNQSDLQTALNGKLNTTGTADKALKDSNGLQINTNYMRKTIGDTSIPATPTGPTGLAIVGRQGCGNGNIAGGNLIALHKNTFYRCYERGSTITCNYDDKVANLGKNMCTGTFYGHYTAINPSTSFASKPFVWEVTSPTQYEASDVCRLHLYGHRLVYAVNVTKFKIEAYIQDTLTNSKKWVTVLDYSGASKNIAQTGFGLYVTGYSSTSYYSIFGVRLTISESPDTVFGLSEIQIVASRGTELLADSLQCVSNAGGKIWGGLEVTGNLINKTQPNGTNNTTVATTAFVQNAISNSSSNVDVDSKSITKTSDNKLQAVGVLDARSTSTALKTWTGTRAQYDAIATKDNNTIYHITDDSDVTLSLLEALYPVGAIYIGTMATCPLQVLGVGTWSLKSANALVTSVDETAGVAGNGMALGLTDGTSNFSPLISNNISGVLYGQANGYGTSTGTQGAGGNVTSNKYAGVTTDATKSGLEATVASTSISVKIWERIS